MDVASIQQQLREFARERDWEQFHSPKNLAMALSVESAELLELFQWLTSEQSERGSDAFPMVRVREELADVSIYLLRIADVLGVDLCDAVAEKIASNARKYPANEVRGSARKR